MAADCINTHVFYALRQMSASRLAVPGAPMMHRALNMRPGDDHANAVLNVAVLRRRTDDEALTAGIILDDDQGRLPR
jgi:hypothetical protein